METLVVASQYRNQNYRSFGSSSSVGFRGINCRTFQSGTGLLPTPIKPYSTTFAATTPVSKPTFTPSSPKNQSFNSRSEEPKGCSKRFSRSSAAVSIPITFKPKSLNIDRSRSLNDKFHFSETWAGPTYSNSPPPSSLPIPKFCLRPKRTVSLELPFSPSDIDLHPIARSAPSSPTREKSPVPFSRDLFDDGNDTATKNLCRILNLDLCDEY